VLCQLEFERLTPLLNERPSTPWLWLAPTAAWTALADLPGRGLTTRRTPSVSTMSARARHPPFP